MTVLQDADAVAAAVAERVASALNAGTRTLVLAGGSTFRAAYQMLARAEVEWGRVTVLFGDERCVPPSDPESNYRMAREELLDGVAAASVHRMPAELGAEAAADAYEATVSSLQPLGLVLLGTGPDGHTASLFPGHEALRSDRFVASVHGAPKPPPDRVTLTLRTLSQAKRVLIVATGEDKAAAVARAQRGEVPAGMIPKAEWLVDRAASALVAARA